ncbi:MAG: CoA-binding protein, partial [Actinomycetospora chiangmaiensis]|nr:CoA-binding protein [Actinomycetospora chiangmaiensis]
MSTYRFDKLLAPRAIALIGAVAREGSVARSVLDGLRASGFPGAILPVQPDHAEVDGLPCVPQIADLATVPDLVLIAVPPPRVPEVVAQAAEAGAGAAVILTARLGSG